MVPGLDQTYQSHRCNFCNSPDYLNLSPDTGTFLAGNVQRGRRKQAEMGFAPHRYVFLMKILFLQKSRKTLLAA